MNRRKFFKQTLMAGGGLVLAPLYVSCNNDDDTVSPDPAPAILEGFTIEGFDHGVASFDPTESSIILWTRFPFVENVTLEVASDSQFSTILRTEVLTPTSDTDFTIAVDVQELPSNQKLYYRFFNEERKFSSVVGETITLPKAGEAVNKVTLAVASCANYQAGLFNVYDAMAKSDADVIVHLGDYIYETAPGEFGTNASTAELDRFHDPANEIITLNDYRGRYKQYRSDKSLQLAHQKKPFICVWDDHEIANNAYKDGAANHTEGAEGSFEERKQTAIRVYSEFIPIRTSDPSLIYRSFDFGNLLSLHMLDTRITGRDRQVDITNFFTLQGFDAASFGQALLDPTRRMLGDQQLGWVSNSIQSSNAEWQLLGQQVLMAKMLIPAELLQKLQAIIAETQLLGQPRPETLLTYNNCTTELLDIKLKQIAGLPLTPVENARITTVLTYNLDAWDGYAVERERLFASFANKKVISLAGDTHNAWYSDVKNLNGDKVATEVATASISSSGFEAFLPPDPSAILGFEISFTTLIDDLIYFDAKNRGFLKVVLTPGNANAQWNFVSTLTDENYTLDIAQSIDIA